ncbi:M14 family zinc carboxypeptidase [Proteiniphilum saccharofermentans]|uniref:M14 family zinc carboxypeptidase n=1 Tax=Proteiniphilum saccharofermentans TaxID=1642647 RepID=UPI0008EBDDD0|nr:M14 family zinc carboxypeptidase [Proteiniphilum saccharofermentans]SFL12972.1 Zinc carboxypeptidase [Porphyromonadaceae bacterium KH3CP3RA]
MKKVITTIIISLAVLLSAHVKAEKTDYFFAPEIIFDSTIPTPEEFLGYEIGSRITEHSRINAYYEKLAELSDRTSLIEIGQTHEKRKLYVLIVSSPENIRNLDRYKEARKNVRQGEKPDSPLIVFLGSAVHGNEISSSEAALLSAYYYVAAQNDFLLKQLEEGIYFIDPVRNPDGQERFASWVNSNTSVNSYNISQFDREHTEGWPRGRGNHYWFDLNRDWVNIVHPESKARVAFYQDWLPHVQADHHEMGTNSTFFFEPTDPDGNESRFVPQSTYQLNRLFADHYAKALDKIGSFYYTKESYDNKNPNFGSTYPDYNGGVGILFEQGSSRGLKQESDNGIVTLPFTVRNQLVTSIATVDAAIAHRDALFDLQKEFFTPLRRREASKSYIIGDSYDLSRLHKFVQLLLDHRLEVYENPNNVTIDSVQYEKGKSYIIPAGQPNSALVGIIFDDIKEYEDASKLGYGAGFSVAYSTGLSYNVTTSSSRGARVQTLPQVYTGSLQPSEYAYLVDYRDSKSQQLLFRLLEKDILVKSAFKPFSISTDKGVKDFSYGSLLIPVKNQTTSSSELYAILKELAEQEKIDIIPVSTGLNVKGVDLGSSAFKRIEKPKVLVVTGGDVSSLEAGEVWHLFDQQLKYPLVRVDFNVFGRVPLNEFNRIVFVSGNYSFLNESDIDNVKSWVRNGGVLITLNGASRWAISNKVVSARLAERPDTAAQKQDINIRSRSFERFATSIFQTKIDLEHPVAFGLTSEKLPVVRESSLFLAPSSNAVSVYTDDPLLNGYISAEHLDRLKSSASILAYNSGRGSVILFAEDPLFRGIWDATGRTFVNAVLFGNNISGR